MTRKNMALIGSIVFALLAFVLLIVAGNDWLHTPPWVDVLAVFASPLALMGSLAWLIRWDDLNKPTAHVKPAHTPTRTPARRPHTTVTWYEFHDNQ